VAGGDNLTIQIGADSSKLRADLKLTQAELKNLDRQINAAVKTGDTARARELANTFGKLQESAVALERGLKGLGATGARAFNEISHSANRADASINVTARSASRLFKQLQSLPRTLGIGGTLLGGGIGGAVGAGVGIGINKLIEQLGEYAKTLREIRDISRETTVKPLTVQATQELAAAAGESAETANKFLTGLHGTLAQVATKTRDLRTGLEVGGDAAKQSTQNFAGFGDKVVEVFHGAEPRIRDFSDALAILRVREQDLIKLPIDKQMQLVSEAFLKTQKNAKALHLTELQLNEVAKAVFKVPTAEAAAMATALINKQAKEEDLAKAQRGATEQNLENLRKEAQANAKLAETTSEAGAAIAKNTLPARTALTLQAADFLTNLPTTLMQVLTAGAPGGVRGPDFGGGGELGVPAALGEIKKEALTLPAFFSDLMSKIGKIFTEEAPKTEFIFPIEPIKQEANTLPPFFQTLGTAIGTIWKNTFSPSGMGDPSIPAMPVDATKNQFGTLPAYFQGLADQIKGIWADLMKTLAAQNAAAAASAKGLGDTAKAAAAPMETTNVFMMGDAGGGDAGSAGGLPTVLRGTGRGPDDGHGPVVGGAGSGYGPQRATQSTTPGFSDYQAQPFRVVSPMREGTYGSQAAKSAAEASADAAAASRTAAEASRSAADAWTDPSYNYASGGMVRGPGSGTSDSILARVSNGEFIMRAAAVNRLGTGFLSRLNGFADGGMVMPSRGIPSFAGGGLVEASGGTPVHLHLGSHSFALSGNSSVVSSLVTEAHRHRMRAAGTKPSWYGGSPGR